ALTLEQGCLQLLQHHMPHDASCAHALADAGVGSPLTVELDLVAEGHHHLPLLQTLVTVTQYYSGVWCSGGYL
ncbi:hypothetical protein NDU88_000848, partial [Pleurodeles waltl]